MDVLFIDHYDSFSHNVIDWISRDPRVTLQHVAFDDREKMRKFYNENIPLVLSPGPNSPRDVDETLRLVSHKIYKTPILGICLGHQILGHICGSKIVRAKAPFHGSKIAITAVSREGVLRGMPDHFSAATYNSLVVETLPPGWTLNAVDQYGEIQGMEHRDDVLTASVQFHPESFLSDDLSVIRKNWIDAIVEKPGSYRNVGGKGS